MDIFFTVNGRPEPQGSTRAFLPKGCGRPVITSANKNLKPWRQDVSLQAVAATLGMEPTANAVEVQVFFYFAKPKSTPKRITHKTTKPDVDKLLRSILDSLSGIVFLDDSQVVSVRTGKRFGLPERAEISVRSM